MIFVVCKPDVSGQEGTSLRFVFYNVENLFDTKDDTLTDDNEFLPSGSRHWTEYRYRKKLSSLYKVLAAAGEWEPPALAGFCEIENRRVLYDLIYDTWLSKYNYRIITGETEDRRGIRNGIIYRQDKLKLLNASSLGQERFAPGSFKSRKILYARFLAGKDTIHIFLNHWPSRRGGALAESSLRGVLSSELGSRLDSIYSKSGDKCIIIVAGDFNCTPEDQEIIDLCAGSGMEGRYTRLVNLTKQFSVSGTGSYKYRGHWEMIDQVLVSKGMLDSSTGLFTGEKFVRIFNPEFLLMKDESYPGFMPFPTFRGFRYTGGFSDHLPLILDLRSGHSCFQN